MVVDLEGFGSEVQAALVDLRALALSRMRDTFVVEFKTGETVQNEETGQIEDVWSARYTTPGRLKDMGYADSDREVGGRREALGSTQVHLPWDVERPRLNDRVRVTAIGPSTPARHLGKAYYVGTDMDASDATATRLTVKEDPWPSA